MGFHGYGHTSGIIGDYSIADCPEGPQIHYHSPDSTSYSHGHHHLDPNRSVVPRHRNDGPVDLSQYCTPTGRGTWSIGGQRRGAHASPMQIGTTSSHQTKSQPKLAYTFGSTTQTMQNRATFTENMASVEQARLYQLNPNVDPPKFSLASTDAKDERSNSDNERAELERIVAALPNIVRAMAFPLPVCHEHPHICANTARIMGAENASAFPPTTVASQRANGDVEGIRGLSATGDIARQIGRYRPGISNTSSSQSGSTAFAEDGSNGPNSEGSPSTPSSCCDSDNKIQEDRKGAV